jgi:hypothetical protein
VLLVQLGVADRLFGRDQQVLRAEARKLDDLVLRQELSYKSIKACVRVWLFVFFGGGGCV